MLNFALTPLEQAFERLKDEHLALSGHADLYAAVDTLPLQDTGEGTPFFRFQRKLDATDSSFAVTATLMRSSGNGLAKLHSRRDSFFTILFESLEALSNVGRLLPLSPSSSADLERRALILMGHSSDLRTVLDAIHPAMLKVQRHFLLTVVADYPPLGFSNFFNSTLERIEVSRERASFYGKLIQARDSLFESLTEAGVEHYLTVADEVWNADPFRVEPVTPEHEAERFRISDKLQASMLLEVIG